MNDKAKPPVPPVRLVSETSAETINAQRQRQEIIDREGVFASALLELMANALRVTAGAGKPYELIRQILAVREAGEAWAQRRAQSDLPIRGVDGHFLAEALCDLDWRFGDPAYFTDLSDEAKDALRYDRRRLAERGICDAALRVVAAQWMRQPTHESKAQDKLYDAIRSLEDARDSQLRKPERGVTAMRAEKQASKAAKRAKHNSP
ncbi:MAG: hypothetical protein FWD12_10980 [Alphaproteobacteria bacterium]|nr:hypothetical protein [Alphaproteobacteria bacterium]